MNKTGVIAEVRGSEEEKEKEMIKMQHSGREVSLMSRDDKQGEVLWHWLARFVIKFLWNTAMLIYLHIVCCCFGAMMTELSKCVWTTKPKVFTLWTFTERVCLYVLASGTLWSKIKG